MTCPLMQYQADNDLTLRPTSLGFGDYKPNIALIISHKIYINILPAVSNSRDSLLRVIRPTNISDTNRISC